MKHLLRFFQLMTLACCVLTAQAQDDWFQFHVNYGYNHWAFPYTFDHVSYFDFDGETSLRVHLGEDEDEIIVPFTLTEGVSSSGYQAGLDSITFSKTLTEWGKDKYKCFAIYVTTNDGSSITSKEEYTACYVSVDGMGEYPDMSGSGRIRGRGNSTWEWYPKKPYRLKFDLSSKVLGVEKNKDWVLLANYRDMTDMMNVYASITAKWMGIPYTTPVRFAELFINGEYMGIYQIAEQVEVGGHRVAIDETEGVLLSLDVDDGPELSPGTGDNFWTQVYNMPMAVKSPEDLSAEQLQKVKDDFAVLERAIKAQDYAACDSLMDLHSFIAMMQLQEYLYNVELSAPRSLYLFRDKGGKYTFGPAWDWDAGFDFDWSNMTSSHTFFTDYRETIFGSDPYRRNGDYQCSKFFTDLFGNTQFVQQYKEQWNTVRDSIYLRNWEETQLYVNGLNALTRTYTSDGRSTYTSPQQRESERWPVRGFSPSTETSKLKTWLQNRLNYIDQLVQNYPEGEDTPDVEPDDYTNVGTIRTEVTLDFSKGYAQDVKVEIDKNELASLLGVSASSLNSRNLDLVPLDADGEEGTNTAAGAYGAWFDADGYTADYNYGNVHVYIESGDLYSWKCGCHPYNCADGDVHTVMMQYRYSTGSSLGKSVNVVVTFKLGDNAGDDDDPVVTPEGWTLAGTLNKTCQLSYYSGYSQSVNISVTKAEVAALLGVDTGQLSASTLDLVPLNADGSEGTNTAAGTYGAWFDASGNTVTYRSGNQHVFIESDDLWTWGCGLERDNTSGGDQYTVTMQYRYATGTGEGLLVNVKVKFTVSNSWW